MKILRWIPPCGCIVLMGYEKDQNDIWDENKQVVVERFGEHETILCKDHLTIEKAKARDVCWKECKKVSAALRNLVQLNPNVIEKISTIEGEIERYRDGVVPIRYEDVDWEGEGENRIPHIKINPRFRAGVITQAQLRSLSDRVRQEFPDIDILGR